VSRTFSLASLLLGITAFCVLCGLAVNYPLESMAFIALPFLFFFPPCFCFVLSRFSPRPQVGLVASLVGMYAGYGVDFLLSRFVFPSWQPISSLAALGFDISDNGLAQLGLAGVICACASLPPLFGAAIFGGAAVASDLYSRRSTPPDESLDEELNRLFRN
jgi:hypothetical protein